MNQFRFDSHEPCSKSTLITVALISGVVAAFLMLLAIRFTGLGAALVTPQQIPMTPTTEEQTGNSTFNTYEKAIIDVYNRVKPSVVMITTDTLVEEFDFFSGASLRNIEGLGSGVVFRKDGYILTNRHVVTGVEGRRVSQISVVLANGKAYPARVVGVDSQTDLAVLRIARHDLTVSQWADSEQIQVGQTAIAIGNPIDEDLRNTVTVGVVSATGRIINDELELHMLQTDASINPGNSGGPLLNSSGNIIGINTAIAAKSQGIGFAIPGNTAKQVANQLIEKGYVSRPGLGIASIHFLPENVAILEARLRRILPVKSGLFVGKVVKGSPADHAGVVPGDVIYSVNGKDIKNIDLVREFVITRPIGTEVKLGIYHKGKKLTLKVRTGEMRQKEDF